MGYIMPVSHFQYQDYQVRDIKGKSRPFYVEKPYKVVLERAYEEAADSGEEEMYSEQDYSDLTHHENNLSLRHRHAAPKSSADQFMLRNQAAADTLAEVTGKGLTFNKHV